MKRDRLRISLLIMTLTFVAFAVEAAPYKMTIIAGKGAKLDLAFAADGCAGVCQGVTLACHCYSDVYTRKEYVFPHGTSNQRVWIDFTDDTECKDRQLTFKRVDGSSHDTRCVTCIDGQPGMVSCPSDTKPQGKAPTKAKEKEKAKEKTKEKARIEEGDASDSCAP